MLANAEPWDVILLEVALTGLNGLVLLEQLQNNPKTSQIPVILLTSRVMHYELEYYRQFKIAGVIAKPFDLRTLAQRISAKLGWLESAKPCNSKHLSVIDDWQKDRRPA